MSETMRPTLGNYMSAICFRYLRQYAEETAGRGLIVMAGKQRGLSLDDYLKGIAPDDTERMKNTLNAVLGEDGTRLCLVHNIQVTEAGYDVVVDESACSTGVKAERPNCAFTMGVFAGAMEVITKQRYNVFEPECVAVGDKYCLYRLEKL